jgi:cyclomaltodextrinase
MADYFPDMWFHGAMGHLYPWTVRFDPEDAAHLSHDERGLHFRVITEPGFVSVHLVSAEGEGTKLRLAAQVGQTQVWELTIAPDAAPRQYTFALLTTDGRPVYLVPSGIANAVERLDRWTLDPERVADVSVPGWARGAVIYQIFPERFRSGDDRLTPDGAVTWGTEPRWLDFQGGDLPGIAEKTGYLADLGVDAVYVNPIFRAPSTHRYDAIDYYEVEPALGGNEALSALVAALHERGMRLIVDASFNHCHPRFFAFADVVENGPASDYWDWFRVTDYPPRVVIRPGQFPNAGLRAPDDYLDYLQHFEAESGITVEQRSDSGPAVETTYEAWYGVPSLPRINLANLAARNYFLEVARHWVREFDIDGWRMDVARYVDFDFWPAFRQAVKEVKPEAYLIAEILGDAGQWLQGNAFDATMNYTFRELCLDFLATRRTTGTAFAEGLVRMYTQYPPAVNAVNQNLIGSHDVARFLYEAGEDHTSLALATVLQLTLPGAPGLYYGDEIGMTGGEEPASRNAYLWSAPDSWHHPQLELVRSLTALRRDIPALKSGRFAIVAHAADLVAFSREGDEQEVLVVINRGPDPAALSYAATSEPEILWGSGSARSVGTEIALEVPAGSALVAIV